MRTIIKTVKGQATSDGAGVRLMRSIGTPQLSDLDPFLMLDEFKSDNPNDYIAGFPPHPHRGFETVTYMLAGSMEHQDNAGNKGFLTAGSVQWMTAGRGIVHSEMPKQENGLMWGFQLWVNLPAKQKMTAPRYQDIPPENIPEIHQPDGCKIRVIAGHALGKTGPVEGIVTQPLYLDVTIPANGQFTHDLPEDHQAFVYVFEGQGNMGVTPENNGTPLGISTLGVLSQGTEFKVSTDSGTRYILLAAKPVKEPIVKYGPFVMNTFQEIEQAVRDYQRGLF
ncbi:MAG: pirin family protein [SAR324 cluster bacterium]|nr:pirin family protein [SAR324 cluster bacterium]